VLFNRKAVGLVSPMVAKKLMMPPVMVVSQPEESDSQADYQGCQQGKQGHHQSSIDVPEHNPLGFAGFVQIGISLVAHANPNGREAQTNQGSGGNNGTTKSSHRKSSLNLVAGFGASPGVCY
jgi:hypothetical protein